MGRKPAIVLSETESVFHARLTARLVWILGLVYSTALALGGPGRWTSPSTAVARQVPGGVYTWAAVLFLASATAAAGALWLRDTRLVTAGTFGCGAWYLLFAITAAVSFFRDGHAGVGGPVVSFGMAAFAVVGVLVARNATPRALRVTR